MAVYKEQIQWACGHVGVMEIRGDKKKVASRVAYEVGRKCFVCWLLDQWECKKDARRKRDDRIDMALAIAAGKGVDITLSSDERKQLNSGMKSVVENGLTGQAGLKFDPPLWKDSELIEELENRGYVVEKIVGKIGESKELF